MHDFHKEDYYEPLKDLRGRKFGFLTVVRPSTKQYRYSRSERAWKVHPEARWFCHCDCGNPLLIPVIQSSLLQELTLSCGCWAKERNKESLVQAREARKRQEQNSTDQGKTQLNKYALLGYLEREEFVPVDDMAYLLVLTEDEVYQLVMVFNQEEPDRFVSITPEGLQLQTR